MLERNTKAAAPTIPEIAAQYDRVALVFQGGGALGAYQAGVYQALAEAGCEPTWLSGVSIGAVNAAIIAGNEPSRRLQRLEQFWQIISGRKIWAYTPEGDFFRDIRNRTSSWMTMTMGQPGFFKPRFPNPWLELPGAEGATSFYDSAELKKTLEMLIDFDLLNDGKKRFSVGAVNVRTGNFVYFDTDNIRIGPEHIMASGALPPALPAIRIEGEYYWDGGIVSNTPLQYLLDQEEDRSSLVFQVDLFSARGVLPRSMPDVLSRHKDIMYSSRTRQNTDNFKRIHGLKMKLLGALRRVPKDQLTPEEEELIADYSDAGVVNIVHLIYQHKNYEGHAKDYEFSGTSMREHWDMGLEDTKRTLRHSEWLLPPFSGDAVAIHDLHREDPV
ncbi:MULTISPECIES: patatin-like phospholipase family protein [Rhizobium]|uniref:Patatin-like phospholipase family protein n=1 Tax=Rhizobium tropici TaxID=398 RepID=A0A329Y8J9_RHITR|nr:MULTISPECIES: patatin-like phospholipase family protein [Rhizobium]MBB3290109.1 NTE family protein [Rhizobium sp. BK252]MBB3405003.1 NTE family protein [Rhizobium sp. BK289]MBB3417549.1 NTE family protein [Rhizobium sp. BK284]MBB3485259.1 NTE family protein [Rhizobium sp. BK347]MDK4720906.1 patatin-like phospholipase family protein [Rhizobium sp. CNPSo 3968]